MNILEVKNLNYSYPDGDGKTHDTYIEGESISG